MNGLKELAEACGFTKTHTGEVQLWLCNVGDLERFAKLVAAKERERIALMIEDAPPLVDFCKNDRSGCLVCGFTPSLAAQTIRELK